MPALSNNELALELSKDFTILPQTSIRKTHFARLDANETIEETTRRSEEALALEVLHANAVPQQVVIDHLTGRRPVNVYERYPETVDCIIDDYMAINRWNVLADSHASEAELQEPGPDNFMEEMLAGDKADYLRDSGWI